MWLWGSYGFGGFRAFGNVLCFHWPFSTYKGLRLFQCAARVQCRVSCLIKFPGPEIFLSFLIYNFILIGNL